MKILLAIDGSPAALRACRLVAGYAGDRARLDVTLLNVQRPPLRLMPQAGLDNATLSVALRGQGQQLLREAGELLAAQGIAAQTRVEIGPPAETVLAVARTVDADAVVMGGGRRGIAGGYAIGSVALRTGPAADCPVVLVGPEAQLPRALGRKLRVLAPVDGSTPSLQAIRRLVQWSGFLGELHVDLVHFHPGLTLAAAILPPHEDVLQEWSGREADHALAEPARILENAGIAHAVHRLGGAPEAGIADFAVQCGSELIAMGTRGAGAMHHMLLGSVALRTAQAAGVPVALLR